MLAEERMVVREGTRYWWVFLVSGIVWLFVAWIVLRLNETSVATVGVLLGIVFIAAGLNEGVVGGLLTGGWKFWHYLMSFIFLVGGIWSLINPIDSFFALASVLGLILFFYGIFEVSRAIALHGVSPYWWVGLATGILLILLAFWVSGSDRAYALAQRSYLILFWVGFMAVLRGINLLTVAFGIRRLGKMAGA